jgi:hypothetical protein
MLTYDPVASLQHYPIPMGRFGSNPYGQPLYRIVFAPSRRYLVVGEWPDGSNCANWVPKYKAVGNNWIMERWRSATEYHPPGKANWDATMLSLGPWPERGEYEHCHTFEACAPSDANLEKLVMWIEAGMSRPFSETLQWHRDDEDRQRKDKETRATDIIRNALPAWGCRPFAGAHGRRVTPMPMLYTAEDLGLPTTPGMRTKPNRPPLAA